MKTQLPEEISEQQRKGGRARWAGTTHEARVAFAKESWRKRLAKYQRAAGVRVNKAGVLVSILPE